MDEYKYLILAEVGDSPYLVLADDPPPGTGFVVFREGTEKLMGRIVMDCLVKPGDPLDPQYRMFSLLHPIFEAVEMYTCCYEKEVGNGKT
jgi:hypothetical protein